MSTFNITPKRLEALRYIAKHPKGVAVGAVAENVLAMRYEDGKKRPMWSQASTRLGAGYCLKMIDAGLLKMRRTDNGFADVWLTEEGQKVIDNAN